MDLNALKEKALYLMKVDNLSARQVQEALGIGYRKLKKLLDRAYLKSSSWQISTVEPYRHLVNQWYEEYPHLKSKQVFERLRSYDYKGSTSSVERFTRQYRQKKTRSYLTLNFLPGEEAQIDWFFYSTPKLGKLAGFLYMLSYSRYAWGGFYPRTSFEFFIQGHLEALQHLKGLAHTHRYDNLKSVVIKRKPEIQYNAQFLDFARCYSFKIHACNPYSGNEKGRVERLIRDIRSWLYDKSFESITQANEEFRQWLKERNERPHRTTGKSPLELLGKEKLIPLPKNPYSAQRIIQSRVLKTAVVEFDTNRYSVPPRCAGKLCDIVVSPERVTITVDSKQVASHKRSFSRKKLIHNPLHSESSNNSTFKAKRILGLITMMEPEFSVFISAHEDEREKLSVSYEIFLLLKCYSRRTLVSAVGELNRMKSFKTKALKSLLGLPSPKGGDSVYPHNEKLLRLNYNQRSLEDYDPN